MLLSFTIPCYRSEHTIKEVTDEIITEIEKLGEQYDYEIIAVNDASPDGTWEELRKLNHDNSKIKIIDLAKNVGKHAALMAAYFVASGDIVISLDDDGQCPIDHLAELLEPLDQGYDMSMAKYPVKKESFIKRMGSRLNDRMARFLIGKPRGMVFSNFSAQKRFVCEEIIKYSNPYPYLEGLTLQVTNKIALVPMEERDRISGEGGYTLRKSISLWLNGFTAFSVRPLRVSMFLGILFAIVGFCAGIYIVVRKLIHPEIVAGYTSTIALILLVGGIIMILLGIIGEYLGRIYICINNSPQYVIREERVGKEKESDMEELK